MLGYSRIMYLMWRGFVIDGHTSLTLASLLLLHCFVNVLTSGHFLLMNTSCHAWSRLVTLCHELHYIHGFVLYSVSMTLVHAT
jgi:hypothetical protein